MNQQTAPQWTVVSQQETARPMAGGQVSRGVMVTFRLATGEQGSVFVDDAHYNADAVRALILERVQQINAVRQLRG